MRELGGNRQMERSSLPFEGQCTSNEDVLLGEVEQDRTLAPNATYTGSLTKTLPEGIQGEYFLIAVPDATNTIAEGDGETTGRLVSSRFKSLFILTPI